MNTAADRNNKRLLNGTQHESMVNNNSRVIHFMVKKIGFRTAGHINSLCSFFQADNDN